jgi:pimeloyl-ACP methyl ester carboxylesterase
MAQDIPSAQLALIDPAAHLGPVESGTAYAQQIAAFARHAGGAVKVGSAR